MDYQQQNNTYSTHSNNDIIKYTVDSRYLELAYLE